MSVQRKKGIFQSRRSSSRQNQVQPYLHLNISKLVFQKDKPNINHLVCDSLTLTNPNNIAVQYKIRSTTPFNYIVRPFQGLIQPKESIQISIKLILGDRDSYKFNSDRFEILGRPLVENSDPNSKVFWQGAQSYKLGVQLIQTFNRQLDDSNVQYKTLQTGIFNNRHNQPQNSITINEVNNLQSQIQQLKQRNVRLKKGNLSSGFLTTKNFIVVGFTSILLGILFS